MSFYTALTGLNGSQSDISATSNNIANVNTTGFKRFFKYIRVDLVNQNKLI